MKHYWRKDSIWDTLVVDAFDPDLADAILQLLDSMIPDKKYVDHWDNEISDHYTFNDGSYIFFTLSKHMMTISLHNRHNMYAILDIQYEKDENL